jgi:hypothetical protein
MSNNNYMQDKRICVHTTMGLSLKYFENVCIQTMQEISIEDYVFGGGKSILVMTIKNNSCTF